MAQDKHGDPRVIVEFGKAGLPPPAADGRLDAPAFHRNHAAITAVLSRFLHGLAGDALEIGSGTGQHAVELARNLPNIVWWPTDLHASHLRSITAWRAHAALSNLMPPARIDAAARDWRLAAIDLPSEFVAMFCANVIHIAPWQVTEGLFAGAGRHLCAEGRLFLYGPFRRDGRHNAPSNAAFDAALRRDNPEWGVRDVADLRALAAAHGLVLTELVEMPANNAVLVLERSR
jgi:SAM-dependent methyltransferase